MFLFCIVSVCVRQAVVMFSSAAPNYSHKAPPPVGTYNKWTRWVNFDGTLVYASWPSKFREISNNISIWVQNGVFVMLQNVTEFFLFFIHSIVVVIFIFIVVL